MQMIIFLAFINFFSNQTILKDTKLYELRIYHCEPGKLPDLINRFKNHTMKLFEKHGMTNVGYWIPTSPDSNSLYYVLSYPDLAHRDSSWKHFGNDEEWKKVRASSEANGKIVSSVESIYMDPEDFTPAIKGSKSKPERVFELRTYTILPGKYSDIETRFRDHTMKIFKSHGMTNIAYWKTHEKDPSATPRLIYLLAHASERAAKKSFDDFRVDPAWVAVRDASEKNGKIVDNIKSVFLKPLEFSAYK